VSDTEPSGRTDNPSLPKDLSGTATNRSRPAAEPDSGYASGIAPTHTEELFDWTEAAALLKVRVSWLKHKVKHGQIPCTRPGAGRLVRFSHLDLLEIARMGRQPCRSRGEVAPPTPRPKRQRRKLQPDL
jgi:hypothetical protein